MIACPLKAPLSLVPSPLYSGERAGGEGDGTLQTLAPHPNPLPRVQGERGFGLLFYPPSASISRKILLSAARVGGKFVRIIREERSVSHCGAPCHERNFWSRPKIVGRDGDGNRPGHHECGHAGPGANAARRQSNKPLLLRLLAQRPLARGPLERLHARGVSPAARTGAGERLGASACRGESGAAQFVRAIDAVKKRTQRNQQRYQTSTAEFAPASNPSHKLRDDREAVDQAARGPFDRPATANSEAIDGRRSVAHIAEEMQLPPEHVSDEKYKAVQKLRGHFQSRRLATDETRIEHGK